MFFIGRKIHSKKFIKFIYFNKTLYKNFKITKLFIIPIKKISLNNQEGKQWNVKHGVSEVILFLLP